MNTKNTLRMSTFPIAGTAALVIAFSAGSVIAQNAKTDRNPDRAERTTQSAQDTAAWLNLVRSSTLIGADVQGSDLNKIGTIDDFVVDRGTGRLVFAIIGHGGLLTIGQDLFAAEYSRLSYSTVQKEFSVNMSKEQANRQVEFLPENWKDLGHSSSNWMEKFTGLMSDDDSNVDRYGDSSLANGKTTQFQGTVTRVSRVESEDHEDVIITINDQDGKSQEIVLGPSWYIMGMTTTPSVNDRVEIVAAKHNGRMIATQANVAGRDLKLRDRDGNVQWRTESKNAPRYVLLSDLIGHDVKIGGTTGGEIQNAVVETTSGRIAFFGFDPNDNLFGIGDEISLVPFSAVQISPDLTVWSNASNEVFGTALAMPEDLETMRTQSSLAKAYAPFGLQAPSFKARKQSMNNRDTAPDRKDDNSTQTMDRTGTAWGKDSNINKAFAGGKQVHMSGEYIRTENVRLNNGAISATSLWIKSPGGNQQIILGPDWFVEHQNMDLSRGDIINIAGREAMIDGKEYIAAWNIERDGTRWTLWNDTTPAWVD